MYSDWKLAGVLILQSSSIISNSLKFVETYLVPGSTILKEVQLIEKSYCGDCNLFIVSKCNIPEIFHKLLNVHRVFNYNFF